MRRMRLEFRPDLGAEPTVDQRSPEEIEPPAPPPAHAYAVEPVPPRDEITVRDMLVTGWRSKWIVVAVAVAVVASVTAWMKFSAAKYTATMVVAPATDAGRGGLSGVLSQYSGLASLAGIDLPTGETVSPFVEFTELLTSVTIAERLQTKHDVMQSVFDRYWDATNKRWVAPSDPVARLKGIVRDFFDMPPWIPPSTTALAEYLARKVSVSQVANTGMQRVEFVHKNPAFAVQLLKWMIEEGDSLIRQEAYERTSRQIKYIENKLETVVVAEHRQSLVQLLSDQEQQMMMIQVDLPYAARLVVPPNVPDDPDFPNPRLFLPLSVIGGLLLGIGLVVVIATLRGAPVNASRR